MLIVIILSPFESCKGFSHYMFASM